MARLNNHNSDSFALRDYHHAAKTFTTIPGYPKTPYFGFLFHVRLVFNVPASASREQTKVISVMVKNVDLPNVKMETETLNQYNRKRIIYTKQTYEPIRLVFHDDVARTIRDMWVEYNQHYVMDSKYTLNEYTINDVYDQPELNRKYGLDNNRSVPFLRSIEIYSMGNHEFSKMELVNPIIDSADFDGHNYFDGQKVMEVQLGVQYESVLYHSGTTDEIPGFGEDNAEHYDLNFSTLSENNIPGVGGILPSRPSRQNLPEILDAAVFAARQIDSIAGKVSGLSAQNLTPAQFFTVTRQIVSNASPAVGRFLFPEARSVNQPNILNNLISAVDPLRDIITTSANIFSNGRNIAPSPRPGEVRSTTPAFTADRQQETAITIRPRLPDGLDNLARQLFERTYPPLPSTDPRTRKPPYQ